MSNDQHGKPITERCGSYYRDGEWHPYYCARLVHGDHPHGFGRTRKEAIEDMQAAMRPSNEQ